MGEIQARPHPEPRPVDGMVWPPTRAVKSAMEMKTAPTSSPRGRLKDYKAHYRADAEAIVDPRALESGRRASEQRRLETLVRMLAPRPGESVLDIGCGSGWLGACCQPRGARVCAMDIGRVGVSGARARFPEAASYQVGDVYHLPFAAESFTAVALSEVIEHLEDIDAALAEARRVLLPGGRMVVSVPYRETIVEHLCIHCNRPTPANAHLHRFDREALTACLERQGLEIRAVRLMTNKLLELAGFPRLSAGWPYPAWRLADAFLNRIVPKPAFLCMLGICPE